MTIDMKSLEKTFEKSCRAKITYYTEELAIKWMKKLKKDKATLLKPYKCHFCKLYHLSKSGAEKYHTQKRYKKVS